MGTSKIIYRLSETGYNKVKPEYINNENCLRNAVQTFPIDKYEWTVIADNISANTDKMIQKYISKDNILHVNVGHGAGTFNIALDIALQTTDDTVVYFLESDYLHIPGADIIMHEGIKLGAEFVSLYDHPDKYIDGINPYVENGGEYTKVFLSNSCHWKLTNSTTMTFAAKIETLKSFEKTLRKWTSTTHPHDFDMWIDLRNQGVSLITPIPGYSTHGETAWLTPLKDWKYVSSNA